MLPAFQENGLLPAGVHHSDLRGFEDAFAWNAHRRRIYSQMQHGLGVLYDAGYRLLVVGGDFISSNELPGEFMLLFDCDPIPIELLDARLSNFDKNSRLLTRKVWGGHFFPASFRAKGTGATWLRYLASDAPAGQRGLVGLSID